MTDSLDTLRPEIREAVAAIDKGNGVFVNGDDCKGGIAWATIRAELLRLQSTESRANEWQLRAERAEAGLAEARKNETVALGLWNAAEDRACADSRAADR